MTYACPMHADIRQDSPGRCPTCGMTLTAQPLTASCCSMHAPERLQ